MSGTWPRRRRLVTLTVAIVATLGIAAGGTAIRRSRPSPASASVLSAYGAPCAGFEDSAPAKPRGSLPDDPRLAEWTLRIESAADELVAFPALEGAFQSKRITPERVAACALTLWKSLAPKVPPANKLRREAASFTQERLEAIDLTEEARTVARAADAQASTDEPGATDAARALRRVTEEPDAPMGRLSSFLAPFPDNARLRRALILHYRPPVECGSMPIEGAFDMTEPLMRATAQSSPERLGLTYELLTLADERGGNWNRSFHAITLDVGLSGNALHVMRDVVAANPGAREALLEIVTQRAIDAISGGHPARWLALAAYLEAGAPDPGDPPEPALARALLGDARARRWALGWIPNMLIGDASESRALVRDEALVAAVATAAAAVDTGDDMELAFAALSQTPPGTALDVSVRAAGSPNGMIWFAALGAMRGQIARLAPGHAARDLFAPRLDALRRGLAPHVCASMASMAVVELLHDIGDDHLDAEVAACVSSRSAPLDPKTLVAVCRKEPGGWSRTAAALEATAKPGEEGDYARRVARGCRDPAAH